MNALQYLRGLPWLPGSKEGKKLGRPSGSELRRWLRNGSVRINGQKAQEKDEVTEPVWELIFFPKNNQARVTMMLPWTDDALMENKPVTPKGDCSVAPTIIVRIFRGDQLLALASSWTWPQKKIQALVDDHIGLVTAVGSVDGERDFRALFQVPEALLDDPEFDLQANAEDIWRTALAGELSKEAAGKRSL